MVPESHEIVLPGTQQLRDFFKADDFETEVRQKLKGQYEVELLVHEESLPFFNSKLLQHAPAPLVTD